MVEAGFWLGYAWPTVITAAKVLAIVLPLLIVVAYLVWAERKVMAAMQLRLGPNVVGPFGLFQSFADLIKMMCKETIVPTGANKVVFLIAPMITFVLAMVAWAVIPFSAGVVLADINVGIMFLFAVSSLGVYGIVMAGWASNSRYAFLGALRSAAQMVSYEVSMGFVIITVLLAVGSLNLSAIVEAQRNLWFAVPLLPMFVIFFISTLAETNRHPFDLPEAEAELVAGYQVEYSAMAFGLFFVGEYANMVLMSADDDDLVLGRLAATLRGRAVHVDSRHRVVFSQGRVRTVRVYLGAGDAAALPLRSTDAAWLEGVSAGLAVLGGAYRDRRGDVRPAAEFLKRAGVQPWGFSTVAYAAFF